LAQVNAPASSLPDLSQDYALSAKQIAAYRRDGHVLLRGVANSEEIAAYRPVIAEAVARSSRGLQPLANRDSYHQAFIQVANLWEAHQGIRRFTMAQRFGKIAAELMGVGGVRLWHDQALFKEPGGGPTPWHQDQYYWPLETANTITMWMPLVDVSLEMGVLTFASGSQHEGAMASMAISDKSERFFEQLAADRGFSIAQAAMAAGDATFHSGWTLHRAPGNLTDRMREVMTVIYFEDGARVAQPRNPHQPVDLARWLPGLKPGDPAASPLNPVVHQS
jgi:hypothetical protein